MTVADYIVDVLIKKGATDAFGIPGGVILNLLYAFDKRREELCPHLSYHEQCAGFAACGYAQASGRLGVAYATRGPGFTNLITAIADAYYDSLPVIFITAHASSCPPENMRIMADQEMDTCEMVKSITKKAIRLDDLESFANDFVNLCNLSLEGRKGPVFLDVSSQLLAKEIEVLESTEIENETNFDDCAVIRDIEDSIRKAERPIILIGDGVNQAGKKKELVEFAHHAQIPMVSSRFSHDIACGCTNYYGYVGSHGIRCANFILSKTDLVVSLGNRLHFPPTSESFRSLLDHAHILRCEIDEGEFYRKIPNSTEYKTDISLLLTELSENQRNYGEHKDWLATCNELRDNLKETDINDAVLSITGMLSVVPEDYIVVNDVGNNEFWVSRACIYIGTRNRVLYSKSFGALGSGIGKSIGAFYATKKPVLCFVGDQGLQMNIQELQYISQHNLPIIIVVVNNGTSGMIKDKEVKRDHYLHATKESGFLSPNIKQIAEAFGLIYIEYEDNLKKDNLFCLNPLIVNINVPGELDLHPNLPRGFKCQDLQPAIDKTLYDYLDKL